MALLIPAYSLFYTMLGDTTLFGYVRWESVLGAKHQKRHRQLDR